ncbi:hypothetical protein FVER14953_20012 [Fusarium verticillioides]|nr:hypothetical protein FVER14953_20012 [Fusarium verticillioides]
MCFIDDDVAVRREFPFDAFDNLFERSNIAIHAVNTLNKDENRLLAPNSTQNIIETALPIHTIMLKRHPPSRATQPHPIMSTRMNKLIIHHNIPRLRQTAHKTNIGIKPRIEQQSSICIMKCRNVPLQILGEG